MSGCYESFFNWPLIAWLAWWAFCFFYGLIVQRLEK